MKKAILFALFAVLSFSVSAQSRVTYPMILDNTPAYSAGGYAPIVRNVTTHKLETLSGVQTASKANDTVSGKAVTVITASRKDTLTFRTSLYAAGQVMEFYCTNASNDSTYVKTTSGNINAVATYWLTGTYKAMRIYFDGTNYWILNKQ